jgi:FkbM family methyltransferase
VVTHQVNALGGYEIETADDHIGRVLARGRPYEPWVLAVLRRIVGDGLFVDIGAHAGNHTIHLAKAGAEVVAIEPHPDSFAMLSRNVDRNGLGDQVRLHEMACGSSSGLGTVTVPDTGNTGSATVIVGGGTVEIATLDSLDLAPDAVKIDVEGAEDEVLAGAMSTLSRHRPAIVCERHVGSLDETLSPLGYRRMGGSLAASPTFLYVARRRHLAVAPWALAGSARFAARRLWRHVAVSDPRPK